MKARIDGYLQSALDLITETLKVLVEEILPSNFEGLEFKVLSAFEFFLFFSFPKQNFWAHRKACKSLQCPSNIFHLVADTVFYLYLTRANLEQAFYLSIFSQLGV